MKSNNQSKLKIALDVTWLDEEGAVGGGFQYTERLIHTLVKNTDHLIFAIVMEKGRRIFDKLLEHENFFLRVIDDEQLFFSILKKERFDIIHAPVQVYTLFCKSTPMVATLHDLQHYHFPGFFSREELDMRERIYKRVAFASERLIVSYQHVKDDIIKIFKFNQERIDVCPVGIDVPVSLDLSKTDQIKKQYELPDRFLLYCANLWVHKNHINLIRALKVIHDIYDYKISLVLTGKTDGLYEDYYLKLTEEVRKNRLDGYVKFLGYIPEEDKLLILNNASLVVVPTLYEAGSFPLLEAMNYSVPVVCSNVTSLPDQIGDLRFVFDPGDVEDIASKAMQLLTNDSLKKENVANSEKMVRNLRWENVIDGFLKTYSRAIRDHSRKSIIKKWYYALYDNYNFVAYPLLKKKVKIFKPVYGPVLRVAGIYKWKKMLLK